MKSCLYTAGILISLPLLAILVFWVLNGPAHGLNPYSVARMQSRIQNEIPVGTSKPQVIAWLKANNLKYYPMCFEASHKDRWGNYLNYGNPKYKHVEHDLFVRIERTRSEIVCVYDTDLSFAFDKSDKLIRFGVTENSTCL